MKEEARKERVDHLDEVGRPYGKGKHQKNSRLDHQENRRQKEKRARREEDMVGSMPHCR